MAMLSLFAISGSLRRDSSNTALLQAAARLAPEGIAVTLFEGLGDLPHFNPDLDDAQPASVLDFRRRIEATDGLIMSTPEYAHGVPGVLKNALDWLVGSTELSDKPVALFHASARGTYAVASLTETLRIMGAKLDPQTDLIVPLLGQNLSVDKIVTHEEYGVTLRDGVLRFARAIREHKATER